MPVLFTLRPEGVYHFYETRAEQKGSRYVRAKWRIVTKVKKRENEREEKGEVGRAGTAKGIEGKGRGGGRARKGRNIGKRAARRDKTFHKTDIDSVLLGGAST